MRLHVACGSPASRERWEQLRQQHPDLEIELGATEPSRLLERILASEDEAASLVCHEDVVIGQGFGARVRSLHAALAPFEQVWGVVGNVGVTPSGNELLRYAGPAEGLSRTNHPRLAGPLGPDVLFLNTAALRRAGLCMPALPGRHGHSIALSLECLRLGLACLADSRLFAFREAWRDGNDVLDALRSAEFAAYYAAHFVNHALATPYGAVDLSDRVDYAFLDHARSTAGLADVHELQAKVAARMARITRPTITIACRTLLNRPALLQRAVQSFGTAIARCPELDVHVRLLVSGGEAEDVKREVERLTRLVPGVKLHGEAVPRGGRRHSRTEVQLHAIETAVTDYVWFVDDDDFLFASALEDVRAALNLGKSNLVAGDAVVYREVWSGAAEPGGRLVDWREVSRFRSEDYPLCLSGRNHLPNCSFLLPVAPLRPRLAAVEALGDYNEDYFLLCLALTAPGAEVATVSRPLCGVSHHTLGNTVTETDRSLWDASYATFVGELLSLEDAGSPVLWELGGALARRSAGQRRIAGAARHVQLYTAHEGAFLEEHSRTRALEPHTGLQELRFEVDHLEGSEVRLDLDDEPSFVEIHALELRRSPDGPASARWVPVSHQARILGSSNALVLPAPPAAAADGSPAGAAILRILVIGSDPQLRLEIPAAESGDVPGAAPRTLALRMRYTPLPALHDFTYRHVTHAPPEDSIQLYVPHDGGYAEARSVRSRLESGGQMQRHHLPFRPAESGTLRLDLGDRPAYVEIHKLELRRGKDQVERLERHVQPGRNLVLLRSGAHGPVRLVATGPDPHLLLPLVVKEESEDATLLLSLRHFPLPEAGPFEVRPSYGTQSLQVYWPTEEGYSEQGSARLPLVEGSTETYDVIFHPARRGPLRVDLGDVPAHAQLLRAELHGPPGSPPRSLLPSAEAPALLRAHNIVQAMGSRGVRLYMTGPDPWLILEPPADGTRPAGEMRLSLELRYRTLPELADDLYPVDLDDAAKAALVPPRAGQSLQLYCPGPDGYDESLSLSHTLQEGVEAEYAFTFTRAAAGDLRIDVGDLPALVELVVAEVRDAGETAARSVLADLQPFQSMVHVPGDGASRRFVAVGADPGLRLPVDLPPGAATELRLRLRYLPFRG